VHGIERQKSDPIHVIGLVVRREGSGKDRSIG
jgi:hypothetical protein